MALKFEGLRYLFSQIYSKKNLFWGTQKFVYNTTNPANGLPITVNYGGCNSTCVNGKVGRGPIPEGVAGLDLYQGIYFCCTTDNCNTNSIIVPISNYPRVNSCYSGFGASISGVSANLALPKACGTGGNYGNQYCYVNTNTFFYILGIIVNRPKLGYLNS